MNKKILLALFPLVLFASCDLNRTEQEATEPSVSITEAEPETGTENVSETTEIPMDFEGSNMPFDMDGAANTVVKNPTRNEGTFEIDERMVGRYAVEDDTEMYFEIKPNGKVEISLNALSGYAKYSSENLLLTAYYTDYTVFDTTDMLVKDYIIINFNIVSGEDHFPASCGMSISFKGDYECTYFVSETYWANYNMKFVRQD